jgi:hypothetical protein
MIYFDKFTSLKHFAEITAKDRKYFKQHEVVFWRKRLGDADKSWMR